MTCASCAARIEKKLNKVDGVQASVNYATERARVTAPSTLTVDDLIAVVRKAGYDASEPVPDAPEVDHARDLKTRLQVAAVLAVPVIVLSMIPALQFPGWQWVVLVLSTPVVIWAGWGFHKSALVNARHGATTMDTLISLGTTAAYLWSVWALFFGTAGRIGLTHHFDLRLSRHDASSNIYFEAAVGIIAFILLGRYIEARSRREAGSALRELLALGAKRVTLLRNGVEQEIPIDQLAVGDSFVVRPGEKVATDGEVIEGESAIDAAVITGESLPVDVAASDAVVGATMNTTGRLVVRATAVGADTQLATIGRLVTEAQIGKSNTQRLADRISTVFVPVVLGLSGLTFAGWLLHGDGLGFAFSTAVAVLIIACPCALGLATPTALLAGTGRGAELGIVIRGPESLERARTITTVMMDKTGTLTSGVMSVLDVITAPGHDLDEVLQVAADLEHGSEHPIAKAIAKETSSRGVVPRQVSGFTAVPGGGISAHLQDGNDSPALAGSLRLMQDRQVVIPAGVLNDELAASVMCVAVDEHLIGVITLRDALQPSSKPAVEELAGMGINSVMVTGDTFAAAHAVADELGMDQVHAGVLPQDKFDLVTTHQSRGERVAMIGDGVNDAAALAQADLGIAMGSGTDAAIAASDITLMRSDLGLAVDAVALSRVTLRTIKVNLFWAFFYNVLAIPVAALGFLNPMLAGAAMAFSSVFVVLNSLRLTRFKR